MAKPVISQNNLSVRLLNHMQANCRGKQNAVYSKTLETMFGVKGEAVRQTINFLRSNGHPICSGRNGYYYANSTTEIQETIANLNHRKRGLDNAIFGLQRSLNKPLSFNQVP